MLDGIMHMGRLTVPYTLGDKRLLVTVGRVLAEYREVEAYLVDMRRNPIDIMRQAANLPPSVLKLLIEESVKSANAPTFVTSTDYEQFQRSPHGMAYDVWRALRDNHDEFGMIPKGQKGGVAYKAPNGVGYSITPEQGVQLALDLVAEYGQKAFVELAEIARASSQEVALGNSIGPNETTGQTITPEESQS
jgi:hypothetical protein